MLHIIVNHVPYAEKNIFFGRQFSRHCMYINQSQSHILAIITQLSFPYFQLHAIIQ